MGHGTHIGYFVLWSGEVVAVGVTEDLDRSREDRLREFGPGAQVIVQRRDMMKPEAEAWELQEQRKHGVGRYRPGTSRAKGLKWAEGFPSDEQFAVLKEMAAGVADYCSLMQSDQMISGDAEESLLARIVASTALVWGEGSPDEPLPPLEKAAECGLTKREACVAYMAMITMWHRLNLERSAD